MAPRCISPRPTASPPNCEWAGAHTGITFSPDGNFLVTTMQENALHGWKLADGKHMRMSGYPAKVKSLSWRPRAAGWQVPARRRRSSGRSNQGRPDGQGAAGTRHARQHDGDQRRLPSDEEIAAIGYSDGMVLAARFADAKEVLLRRPGKGAITSMMWDGEGRRLVFGSEAGDCGVIDISA
jgi:hypothetical protein